MGEVRIDNAKMEAELSGARREALEETGTRLLERAMANAPVDSGNLRRSHYLTLPDSGAQEISVVAGAEYAMAVHEGSRPHVIEPRSRRALRFYVGGREVFATRVHHPGNAPDPWLTRSADQLASEGS